MQNFGRLVHGRCSVIYHDIGEIAILSRPGRIILPTRDSWPWSYNARSFSNLWMKDFH